MKTYEERMEAIRGKLKKKQMQRRAMAATAGALCICLVAGFLLPKPSVETNPGKDISQYSDSKYFKVIEAINRDLPQNDYLGSTSDDRDMTNIWNDLIFQPEGAVPVEPEYGVPMAPGDAPDYSVKEDTNSSVEITDHQVAGVLEADIIKRSQTHIFYLKGNTVEVYPIAGKDTALLSTWRLNTKENAYYYSADMYLSADATRINLVITGYGNVFAQMKRAAFVQVISLDVSDPANIKEANSLYITGSLLSSRMVGDQMLMMTKYQMDYVYDFDDESTFLPQYGTLEDMQSIPAENIVVPNKLTNSTYTVVTMLDGKDMTVVDSGAFMSHSTELYVSKDRIYATRNFTKMVDVDITLCIDMDMTEVSCMTYGAEGLTPDGTFCVEGRVKNQYSMDEHDGIFRIVTATTRLETVKQWSIGEGGIISVTNSRKRNANLTCFKVGTWEQVAQVEQFAPEGETVESVRFDGDYAYVCTAVVVTLTDPVFFFDMTDLDNIIVKDTGTIDGYSSSLIQLKDGFLLGIGFDENRCLKVEVYMETADGVESVCTYSQWLSFASDYKAYYIDRENNLFGIPTNDGYILLQFDGYQIHELARTKFLGVLNYTRGVVIDKYLYVFGMDGYAVEELL